MKRVKLSFFASASIILGFLCKKGYIKHITPIILFYCAMSTFIDLIMFHVYVYLSSNIQNVINELEQMSYFVFYIISFILSGDTRHITFTYIYI